ncbi:MAG: folylpolyglutamate synthase/dihydrofolate synthase family protein [Bacteroidales bacterium]|nr:folylpolyglutamate synthase/dihydrofolate synthase family protein [Bacteroidales bacterium]
MDTSSRISAERYEETIEFLYDRLPMFQRDGDKAYKADLLRTFQLDEHFKSPHKNFKTVHVAGTNGKGSVSHILASILQEGGYKVGLYTSPHLKDFRERIKIDGVPVKKEFVVKFVEENREVFSEIEPSFFEMTVSMAFEYFREAMVDIAVIETGLGGRLDSTNIITPILSVITNIGHDHTEFLGSELEDIAYEKSGIIKPGIPVVIGETQISLEDIFIDYANDVKSEITFADQCYRVMYSMITMENKQKLRILGKGSFNLDEIETDLLGSYQAQNVITALHAIDVLKNNGALIREKAVLEGMANVIENTGFRGRWEILDTDPLTICDTGHNIEGIEQVVKQIQNTAYNKLHFVLGLVQGKRTDVILDLLPKDATYYFTRAQIPRALDQNLLTEAAERIGLKGESYETVADAYKAAQLNAGKNDLIFIGGSTFVVAEIL